MDICGNCLLPSDYEWENCVGCDSVPFSATAVDQCGKCLQPGVSDWNACVGCDGNVQSEKEWDTCDPPQCVSSGVGYKDPCPSYTPDTFPKVVPIVDCWISR